MLSAGHFIRGALELKGLCTLFWTSSAQCDTNFVTLCHTRKMLCLYSEHHWELTLCHLGF